MTDHLGPRKRSWNMGRIKATDTSPEVTVRKMLFDAGYRYTVHGRSLPGNPDIVFSRRRKVVFVNGCFWHRHTCRRGTSIPKTRRSFWERKFSRTIEVDRENIRSLKEAGWDVLIIWECEIRNEDMKRSLFEYLGPQRYPSVAKHQSRVCRTPRRSDNAVT